jgi:hypothetical protein
LTLAITSEEQEQNSKAAKVCMGGLFKRLDQNGFSKKKIMNQLKPIQRQTNLIIKTIAPIDAFAA